MTAKPVAIAVQNFNVPSERVYDAILDVDMISRFMFGPLLREEEILHINNDPKVGGEFSYKVRRGETVIDHIGIFIELDRPRRIVFTWAIAGQGDDAPSTVAIEIAPTAEGCTVRLVHEMAPEWADFADRSRDAWKKMLGVLSTLL